MARVAQAQDLELRSAETSRWSAIPQAPPVDLPQVLGPRLMPSPIPIRTCMVIAGVLASPSPRA
eukprot:6188973-Lingulodinium_polyedra.AAC.1